VQGIVPVPRELSDPPLELPFPACDLRSIEAELIGVGLAGDLLVEHLFANARTRYSEARYTVNCVYRETEAVQSGCEWQAPAAC